MSTIRWSASVKLNSVMQWKKYLLTHSIVRYIYITFIQYTVVVFLYLFYSYAIIECSLCHTNTINAIYIDVLHVLCPICLLSLVVVGRHYKTSILTH